MSDQQIVFHLSPDEYKRMRKLVAAATSGQSPWLSVTMSVLYGFQVIAAFVRHHDSALSRMYLAFFVLSIIMAIAVTRSRVRRLPVDGSLQLGFDGFSGTLDSEPATIRWSEIETVRDLEDAIVLFRRRNHRPVVIPKANIADVAALWALLEDRLISKRGLILSAAPRRQISNSAY